MSGRIGDRLKLSNSNQFWSAINRQEPFQISTRLPSSPTPPPLPRAVNLASAVSAALPPEDSSSNCCSDAMRMMVTAPAITSVKVVRAMVRQPTKTPTIPRNAAPPNMVPNQGPRLRVKMIPINWIVNTSAQRPCFHQNPALPTRSFNVTVAATKDMGIVNKITDPAKSGLPKVELARVFPAGSSRSRKSWP